jgi:hypothetical protein
MCVYARAERKLVPLLLGVMGICFGALQEKSEKPIVVITASYNNKQWCRLNVNSIVNQKYTNWRLIYIDDCSTDTTPDIVD